MEYGSTRPEQVAERIADADIVITNKVPVRKEAIRMANKLRLVAIAATGSDVVDVAACAARGVAVSNIRAYAVNTGPEHTFALILALRRSLVAYRDSVREGRWAQSGQFCYFDYPINDAQSIRASGHTRRTNRPDT
jgi:glycerate dehydrogenase